MRALIGTRALIADFGTEAALGCMPVPLLAMLAHTASRRYRSWRSWGRELLVLPADGDQQAGTQLPKRVRGGGSRLPHRPMGTKGGGGRVDARWTARGGGGRQRRGALIATRALIADLGTEAALGCVLVPLLAMLAHIASRRYRRWRSWGRELLVLPADGDQGAVAATGEPRTRPERATTTADSPARTAPPGPRRHDRGMRAEVASASRSSDSPATNRGDPGRGHPSAAHASLGGRPGKGAVRCRRLPGTRRRRRRPCGRRRAGGRGAWCRPSRS